MADARTADFLGGSKMPIAMPKIYAPGEEPNPKNPGGISNNELARRREADRLKQVKEHSAKVNAANSKAAGKKIVAEREAFAKTQPGFFARAGTDLKVLGPAVLKVVGTGAAIVATGGAAAGAIGLGAGLAGLTAAALTTQKLIGAVNTGGKAVAALKKGDVASLANAGKSALAQGGIKTPPLPSIAKQLGGEVVAALPKNIVSDAKAQLASAKQITSSAKAAITAAPKAAVKTVLAAAAKVKPPPALKDQLDPLSRKVLDSVPGAKIVVAKDGRVSVSTPAAATSVLAMFKPPTTAIAINTVKQAAGAAALDKLRSQLDSHSLKLLDTVKGARIVTDKNGKISVSTAALSPTATAVALRPPTSASASLAIKPPAASSKPPAMTQNRPPAPAASVGSSIPAASASAPPALKPPPVADATSSSAPALEGYLVRLNGTIAPRGRYRAA